MESTPSSRVVRTSDFGDLGDGGPPAALFPVRGLREFHHMASKTSTISTVIAFLAEHLQRNVTLANDAEDPTPDKMAWIGEAAAHMRAIVQADACQGFIAWRADPPPEDWQESPGHPYQRVVIVTPATHNFYLVIRDHIAAKPGQSTAPSIIAVPNYFSAKSRHDVTPFSGMGPTPEFVHAVTGIMARDVWERRDPSVRVKINSMPNLGEPQVPVAALYKDTMFVDTLRVAELHAAQAMARPALVIGEASTRDAVVSRGNIIPDPTGRNMKSTLATQQARNFVGAHAMRDAIESNAWRRDTTADAALIPGGLVQFHNPFTDTVTLEAPKTRVEALQNATLLPTGHGVQRGPDARQPAGVREALEDLQKTVCAQFLVPASVLFMHSGSGGRSTGATDIAQEGLLRTVDHYAVWMQTLFQSMYDVCVRPLENDKLAEKKVMACRYVQLKSVEAGLGSLLGSLRERRLVRAVARPPSSDGADDEDADADADEKPKRTKKKKKGDKEAVVDVPAWISTEQRRNLQSEAAAKALAGLPEFMAYHKEDTTRVLVHRMQKNTRVMELLEGGYLDWKDAGRAIIATDMGIRPDFLIEDPVAEKTRREVERARALAAVELETKRKEAEIQIRTEEKLAAIQAKYAPKPEPGAAAPAAAKPKPAKADKPKPVSKPTDVSKPKPAAKPRPESKPRPAGKARSKPGDDKTADSVEDRRAKLKADRDKKRDRKDATGKPTGKRQRTGAAGGGSADEDPTAMGRRGRRVRV